MGSAGSAGALGARAPRRPGRGGRVCKGVGAPDAGRGTSGKGAAWSGEQAGAGRVGSGGRPRWKRRHAGAGPVAAAGRRGRTGRWSAAALRAPLHGVGGRAGGTRAAQARLREARVQGRRRAR